MAKVQSWMRNLMVLKSNEMRHFLNSFDTIITDCDGVLWLGKTPIAKSLETVKKLQTLGKKIIFVTNNSTLTSEEYCEKFRSLGYPAKADQIAIPSKVICWYLKKLKFDGKAFISGTEAFRQVLKAEGIDIVGSCSDHLEESYEAISEQLESHQDVNAVIMDLDVNFNWLKLSKSKRYLRNREVLYLTGSLDREIPFGKNKKILGIRDFVDIISKETGREPVQCAKPSEVMKNYIIEKFSLDDPSRCIFIGDSFENDMKFAHLCGFGKLWVASGIDNIESITPDQHRSTNENHSFVPDYYLPSLGHLLDILKS